MKCDLVSGYGDPCQGHKKVRNFCFYQFLNQAWKGVSTHQISCFYPQMQTFTVNPCSPIPLLLTVDHEGYVQQTNKKNWTLHSNEDKKPCVDTLFIHVYTNRRTFGKGNKQNIPDELDLESSFTFKICSDYACLKVSRETLRTIDSFLEQSRSIQSVYSI